MLVTCVTVTAATRWGRTSRSEGQGHSQPVQVQILPRSLFGGNDKQLITATDKPEKLVETLGDSWEVSGCISLPVSLPPFIFLDLRVKAFARNEKESREF